MEQQKKEEIDSDLLRSIIAKETMSFIIEHKEQILERAKVKLEEYKKTKNEEKLS